MRTHNLQVYNSMTRQKEAFVPINPEAVGMYVCGPTVYSNAHLGNCRTYISFDIIYRYLTHLGYKVRYVRNITDVGHLLDDGEDRMSKGARMNKLEPMEVAQKYGNHFQDLMDQFNNIRPSIEPRASGHIVEQIEMVQDILDNGYAYVENGSVYFDTIKFANDGKGYGNLSGRKIDELFAETRTDLKNQSEKRHPSDFAIWMKADDSHLMKWKSPWSLGFPGWHLECSVMSTKYLGKQFDIHGGGNDLKFPHHENEIAQNVGACNCQPSKYWLHTNMLLMNGRKMSKSDGNTISPEELITGDSPHVSKGYSPNVIRFFMLQTHYRSTLDLTDKGLSAAEKAYNRLIEAYKTLMSIQAKNETGTLDTEWLARIDKIYQQLDDDFNTPQVLASMFEFVPSINSYASGQLQNEQIGSTALASIQKEMTEIFFNILGLKDDTSGGDSGELVDGIMNLVIDMRQLARENKDWTSADAIRDQLAALNLEIKDGKDGAKWSYSK